MTNETAHGPNLEELPEAEVQIRKRSVSIVWLVPLVAVIIGGWLVYKAFSEKGPTITIRFKSAEGLEAGKTKIKYKDVELGQVSTIKLSEDLSQVIVTADLVKQAETFLSENTRFWVVRARVAASGVTGLGTLFSGAFIALDPGKPGEPTHHFKGLEEPPPVTADEPGRHFLLEAGSRGSLEIGSPVYYRKIQVGQVVAYRLAEDGNSVIFMIFINAPYHKYVHTNTRFWNASGVDVKLDAQGIRVDTESLVSLMIGGIAFGTPHVTEPGPPADEEALFILFSNADEARERIYTLKRRWILHFDESVRGLSLGAPVEFRGIRWGEVLDVKLEFDTQKQDFRIQVLIETEPERIPTSRTQIDESTRKQMLEYLVQRGFRAQLKTGNLLTGQKFIEFDIFPDAPSAQIVWAGTYPEIPTVPTPMEEISTKFMRILQKIDKLPIEQIGNDLRDTIHGAKQLVESAELEKIMRNLNDLLQETQHLISDFRSSVTPEISATLKQAQQSLASAEKMLSTESPLQFKLTMALDEIAGAARSLRLLVDYLERHPEALIRGKGTTP
jgi:paraquat-inducible protein B